MHEEPRKHLFTKALCTSTLSQQTTNTNNSKKAESDHARIMYPQHRLLSSLLPEEISFETPR